VAQEDSTALDEPLTAANGAGTDGEAAGSATADGAPADGATAGSAVAGGAAAGGVAAGGEEADGSDSPGVGEALGAGEQRFRRAFGHAPFGMIMTSMAAGRANAYLAVNDAYGQLTGYSAQELSGADFLSDVHPDEQAALEALIQEISAGGTGPIRTDTRLVQKDGDVVPVHLTGLAIQPPDGERYLVSFIEDATAAEQARAEIGRLEHELLQSQRLESLGQLVGGIAHDFNNLLAVIGNYASLVRDEVSAAEAADSATRWEPVRRDMEQIEDAADRAKRLVKHLLAFARRPDSQPTMVDLGQLVSDVVRLLAQVLGDQVRLVSRPGADLWPVEVDPGQLEQAIISLAVNARDAMPTGGQVTIDTANIDTSDIDADRKAAIDLAGLLPGRYVELRVSDTGTGMDAVTSERAFEPFYTTKGGDQAAGLGLSAVHRFVARAGGKAWLQSEPGSGTAVTLMLPAAAGSGASDTGPAAARPDATAQHAGTVLVVDDEAAIRDVVHRVLTRAGYRVMTAAGQAQALGLLREPGVPVDLLVTDVVMPGVTGEAFAAQVEAVRPGIRVLFMSGYELPGAMTGAQILDKPFSRATLLAKVNQLLIINPGDGPG
jgi:PAS domain S-box-containing protein